MEDNYYFLVLDIENLDEPEEYDTLDSEEELNFEGEEEWRLQSTSRICLKKTMALDH